MSGLHFCKTKEWFTKTEKERLNFKKNNINLNDENMLYLITKNSKIYIDESLGKTTESFIKNRPIHGIHISLNRKPFEINAKMCNVISENFKYSFLQHIHSSSFIHLINNFDINFKSIYRPGEEVPAEAIRAFDDIMTPDVIDFLDAHKKLYNEPAIIFGTYLYVRGLREPRTYAIAQDL